MTTKKIESKYSVYVISNTFSSDKYIGVTKGTLEQRFNIHLMHSKSNCSNITNRSLMYQDIEKYGFGNFTINPFAINLSKKIALGIEKDFQLNDDRFYKYSERDINRNSKPKFNSCYKLISSQETLFFKSTSDISKKFKCHRSNVTRSINDGYMFLRKYLVVRISKVEYLKNAKNDFNLFSA